MQVYRYNTQLQIKHKTIIQICVKLTLQWRSNCSDVNENLKLAKELKSVVCGGSSFHIVKTR